MEHHHAINGKTHYFDWDHFPVRYVTNYQRVCFEVASVVKYDEHGFATRTKEQTSDNNIEIS